MTIENVQRMNKYAKYVNEMNLPKIEEGGHSPRISGPPLPNRFTRNHDRVKSMNIHHGMSPAFAGEIHEGLPKKKLIWELEKLKRPSLPDINSNSPTKPLGISDRYRDYL